MAGRRIFGQLSSDLLDRSMEGVTISRATAYLPMTSARYLVFIPDIVMSLRGSLPLLPNLRRAFTGINLSSHVCRTDSTCVMHSRRSNGSLKRAIESAECPNREHFEERAHE